MAERCDHCGQRLAPPGGAFLAGLAVGALQTIAWFIGTAWLSR